MYAQVIIPLLNTIPREEQIKILDWLNDAVDTSIEKEKIDIYEQKIIDEVKLIMLNRPKKKV